MTQIVIRAVRERAAEIAYLTERLPGAVWCLDTKRDAMDTFLRALELAGGGACVHMEDDTLLCADFEHRLHDAISARPGWAIQFFSMRGADLTKGSRPARNFLMGQCFYLPHGYSLAIRRFADTWARHAEHPTGIDLLVADWLKTRGESHWIHVPSLVQHRVGKSVIDPRRSSKRQSKTFEAAA